MMLYFMSLSCLGGQEGGVSVPEAWGGWVVEAEGPWSWGAPSASGRGWPGPAGLQRAPGTGGLKPQLKAALIELALGYGQHRRLCLAGTPGGLGWYPPWLGATRLCGVWVCSPAMSFEGAEPQFGLC